jgi:hypothetical protein
MQELKVWIAGGGLTALHRAVLKSAAADLLTACRERGAAETAAETAAGGLEVSGDVDFGIRQIVSTGRAPSIISHPGRLPAPCRQIDGVLQVTLIPSMVRGLSVLIHLAPGTAGSWSLARGAIGHLLVVYLS